MKNSLCLSVICLGLVASMPAQALDSGNNSATSVAAVSVAPASVIVVSTYVGSVMVVESVRVIGDAVEVVFKGAVNASRAVVRVTAASAKATSIAAGQSVQVVAEGTGYLLVSAGKVLCYVPGKAEQDLLRSGRSS